MADTEMPDEPKAKPMDEADDSPSASAEFKPAAPLKDAGVTFEPESEGKAVPLKPVSSGDEAVPAGGVRQQLTAGADRLQAQAGDGVRGLVDMGKQRAVGALEQLEKMLTDAADQVDAKLGGQYGGYARNAADAVNGFSRQVQDQNADDLLEQGRELVRKSPAVAVGAAAAVGFVLARLIHSGVDADRA